MIARPVRGSASTTGTSPRSRPRLVRASRQDAISGRFSGTFPLLSPISRSRMAADSPGSAETIYPGRDQGRLAGESRFRAGNCARAPDGPRHGQRRLPGCGRQWLLATAGNMQEHNRDIGSRSSLSDRGRLPVRPRERGTYLTGARPGMSDRSTARNARRTVTVAGHEIDDLDYCQIVRGRASRHGFPAPDNLPILSACPGLARIPAPADDSAISSPPGPADTMAATSGAGAPRFASSTSGRAAGGLPQGACRARAPRACNRGRSSPALVRRTSVSSSDPRPSPRHSPLPGIRAAPGPGSSEAARLRTA
jgi:hypothetical protein